MNPTQLLKLITSGFGTVTEKYAIYLMMAGLVFALLNCFMGYKLRKVWGSILGLILGAAAGAGAAYYFLHDVKYALAAGVAGALVVAVLAWIFYKLGIFVLCTGLVYLLAGTFFQEPTSTSRIICLVIGIFAATMALGYEEYVIIGITGICGGIGAVNLLFSLTGKDAGIGTWILGLILAFLGIAVQSAPLMRERAKDSPSLFDRKKRKKGLPSLPGRRKKTKKKTVYKTTKGGNSGESPSNSGKSGAKKQSKSAGNQRTGYEETGARTQEIPDMENLRSRDYENSRPPVPNHVGTGIDLDDLNRELSQEIQKIYDEDKQ